MTLLGWVRLLGPALSTPQQHDLKDDALGTLLDQGDKLVGLMESLSIKSKMHS